MSSQIYTPAQLLALVIVPTLDALQWPGDQARAKVMLLSIALQESGIRARVQMEGGPARSFWQFERGGIRGVLSHRASSAIACQAASRLIGACDVESVYRALATNDELGCVFARLLLLTNPWPLPAMTDVDGSWDYYRRNWRPGKPRPKEWPGNHQLAVDTVAATVVPHAVHA